MAKRTTSPVLALPPRERGTPAYRWLCSALRSEILDGQLARGARLPATRDLARQYGLSRGTIVSAFEQLRSEGYVEGTVGSGTYVNTVLPDHLLQVATTASGAPRVQRNRPRTVSAFATRITLFPPVQPGATRAFRANQPALDLFPTTLWAQLAGRRLRRASTVDLLGCDPLGYRPLREAVADYVRVSRGVDCATEQVAIVSGVQEALDLIARLVVNPGDRVGMESPGYAGASRVFTALGARIAALGVDDEGLRVPSAAVRGVRLVYVTPAHQFPLGMSMSLARRLALLEWARQSGALLFEDDYDSEFRYAGRPVPALQGLDRHGVVVFAGSFSKVLFPSLRLGYLVVPPDLVDYVAAAQSITNRHAPVLDQAVLSDFIAGGHFGRHVRRMREVYAERLGVLVDCARERLTGVLEISGVEAGLQTVGWLGDGIDDEAVTSAAARRQVEVRPLGRFGRGRVTRHGLQLGFAAVDATEIRRGVAALASAVGEVSRVRR